MTTKLQNLNELRYVIELAHKKGGFDPCYFVGDWPDTSLLLEVKDQNNSINIYDSIYYSPNVVDAKTYASFIKARHAANLLIPDTSVWTERVIAVSAKVFFKARLMG